MKSPAGSIQYFCEVVLLPDVHTKSCHLWSHSQSKWSPTCQGTSTIPVSRRTTEVVPPESTALLFPDHPRLWKAVFSHLHHSRCRKKHECSLHLLTFPFPTASPEEIRHQCSSSVREHLPVQLDLFPHRFHLCLKSSSPALQYHNNKRIWAHNHVF